MVLSLKSAGVTACEAQCRRAPWVTISITTRVGRFTLPKDRLCFRLRVADYISKLNGVTSGSPQVVNLRIIAES